MCKKKQYFIEVDRFVNSLHIIKMNSIRFSIGRDEKLISHLPVVLFSILFPWCVENTVRQTQQQTITSQIQS